MFGKVRELSWNSPRSTDWGLRLRARTLNWLSPQARAKARGSGCRRGRAAGRWIAPARGWRATQRPSTAAGRCGPKKYSSPRGYVEEQASSSVVATRIVNFFIHSPEQSTYRFSMAVVQWGIAGLGKDAEAGAARDGDSAGRLALTSGP